MYLYLGLAEWQSANLIFWCRHSALRIGRSLNTQEQGHHLSPCAKEV